VSSDQSPSGGALLPRPRARCSATAGAGAGLDGAGLDAGALDGAAEPIASALGGTGAAVSAGPALCLPAVGLAASVAPGSSSFG